MTFESRYGYLYTNGKYYEVKNKDGKTFFKRIKKERILEQEKLAKELAKKLKKNLDAEKVLTEIFMSRYNFKDLIKLSNMISKRKYKVKTRKHYCVDMKIGRHIIPIIDD